MMEEAKTRSDHVDKWISAAKRWRLPYWDWARQPSLPGLVSNVKISILDADGTMKEVANPMYRFQMPGARRMGDPHYGDYRIDGNGAGPVSIHDHPRRRGIQDNRLLLTRMPVGFMYWHLSPHHQLLRRKLAQRALGCQQGGVGAPGTPTTRKSRHDQGRRLSPTDTSLLDSI